MPVIPPTVPKRMTTSFESVGVPERTDVKLLDAFLTTVAVLVTAETAAARRRRNTNLAAIFDAK